jgi:predicted CopG family antitoxin
MARTTINIDKEIRESLNACKKYKRETYDEVLKELIKNRKKMKGGLK